MSISCAAQRGCAAWRGLPTGGTGPPPAPLQRAGSTGTRRSGGRWGRCARAEASDVCTRGTRRASGEHRRRSRRPVGRWPGSRTGGPAPSANASMAAQWCSDAASGPPGAAGVVAATSIQPAALPCSTRWTSPIACVPKSPTTMNASTSRRTSTLDYLRAARFGVRPRGGRRAHGGSPGNEDTAASASIAQGGARDGDGVANGGERAIDRPHARGVRQSSTGKPRSATRLHRGAIISQPRCSANATRVPVGSPADARRAPWPRARSRAPAGRGGATWWARAAAAPTPGASAMSPRTARRRPEQQPQDPATRRRRAGRGRRRGRPSGR